MGGRILWLVVPLLGLALLGAGGWLWFEGRARGRGSAERAAVERANAVTSPAPELEPSTKPRAAELPEPAAASRAPAPIPLEAPADAILLAGTVRWPDGTPAVATVQLLALANPVVAEVQATATTSSDGRFRFELEPGPPREVRASADRAVPAERRSVRFIRWRARSGPVAGGGRDLELVLDPGLRQTGWIRDHAGRGLAGSVFATRGGGSSAEYELATASADESGEFLLLELSPGSWRFRAKCAGYLDEVRELELPLTEPPVFRLERGAALHGRLVDELGRPVAGASVSATHFEGQGGMTRTEADGTFALLGLSPGTLLVHASRPGETQHVASEVTLIPEEERAGLMLVLPESGGVSAVVRDARGRNLAGVEVSVSRAGRAFGAGHTDAEGRLAFAGLAPGEYELSAELPGRMRLHARADVLALETCAVELVAPPTAVRIVGRVRVDGAPRAGLALEARRVDTRATVGEATTGEEGAYSLELTEAGELWLALRVPELGLLEWRRVLVPAVATFPLDLELALGHVQGTVWSLEGERLAGIQITAQSDSEDGLRRLSGSARSDENGEFALSLVAGTYLFEASENLLAGDPRSFSPTRIPEVVVRPGERVRDLEFTLERGARLEGVVRRADGTSVYGAHLWLATPGSSERPRRIGQSGTLGRFRLGAVPTGFWMLTASDGERQAPWQRVEVGATAVRDLEFVLE